MCNHEEYEYIGEEEVSIGENNNLVYSQRYICLDCGIEGSKEWTIPQEIDWEDPNQTKII
jgi:hypothetical protein